MVDYLGFDPQTYYKLFTMPTVEEIMARPSSPKVLKYKQPKAGCATFHWLWVLGHPLGKGQRMNFKKSDVLCRDLYRKADGSRSWEHEDYYD